MTGHSRRACNLQWHTCKTWMVLPKTALNRRADALLLPVFADAIIQAPDPAKLPRDNRHSAPESPRKSTSPVPKVRPKTAYETLLDQQHGRRSRHTAASVHGLSQTTPGQTPKGSQATQHIRVAPMVDGTGKPATTSRQRPPAANTSLAFEMSKLLQIQQHDHASVMSMPGSQAGSRADEPVATETTPGHFFISTGGKTPEPSALPSAQQQQSHVEASVGAALPGQQQVGSHGTLQSQQQPNRNHSRFKPPLSHAVAAKRTPTGSITPALRQAAHNALVEAAENAEKVACTLVHAAQAARLGSSQPGSHAAQAARSKLSQHGTHAASSLPGSHGAPSCEDCSSGTYADEARHAREGPGGCWQECTHARRGDTASASRHLKPSAKQVRTPIRS